MAVRDSISGHARTGSTAPNGIGQPATGQQPLRTRRVPQRSCVACRTASAKREFVRLVRTQTGSVEIDPTGKKAGRGAYLCTRSSCWELALKKERLNAALKTRLAPEDVTRLRAYAAGLPPE